MLIFWRLLLAHLLADFTFQTDRVNRWKRMAWWGMVVHTLTHLLMLFVLTFPFLGDDWVRLGTVGLKGWMCLVCVFILHYAQDEWRIFSIRKFKTADGTLHFLWDQVIHIGLLFAFSPIIGFNAGGSFFPEKMVMVAICIVGVTHAGTVFVYFLEKDFHGAQFPSFDEKYLAMAQRMVLWLCCLVHGGYWWAWALLWLCASLVLKQKRIIDIPWLGFISGTVISLALGIFARSIYYQ